tara:strand:+ start:3312 stop:3548 length:237 start_codon:yes stop_codon:yes gene_type:complete
MTDEGMTLTTAHLMSENMKEYLLGKCRYHETNIKIYFQNPVGIGEHPDILGAIEDELGKLAEYKEKLDILRTIERDLW